MTLVNVDKLSAQPTLRSRVRGALIDSFWSIGTEDPTTDKHNKRVAWGAQTAGFNLESVVNRAVLLVAADPAIQTASGDGTDTAITDDQITTAVTAVLLQFVAEMP